MDQKEKAVLSLYAIIYALTALAAFRLGDIVPVPTVYVLLGSLYVIPIWLGTTHQLDNRLATLFLIVTPLLPALIVVDPLEVGFYGYDPYVTLQNAFDFVDGPVQFIRNRFDWPAFYPFVWGVRTITGIPIRTVAKYLPLVSVGAPLLFYLFARLVITRQTAFVAAMGFAGVRTLYAFEVKFVDESTAFLLFFMLLFLLALRSVSRTSAVLYASIPVAVGAILTHHYVSALTVFLLVLWDVSSFKPTRIGRLRDIDWPFSRLTVVAIAVFLAMFLVVVPQFLGFVVSVADVATSPSSEVLDTPQTPVPGGGETPPGSEQSTSPSGNTPQNSAETTGGDGSSENGGGLLQTLQDFPIRFWQLLATNVVLITILSVVVIRFRSWAIDSHPALRVSGVFGGLMALVYGYSVAFGPIIPLDPSRYLIYMTGLLLVPAGYALHEVDAPVNPAAVFSALAVLLILTQLVLIPPVVMYSNQAQTHVGEGHYSPSQFAAGDWVAEYDGGPVVGWEGGAWAANGVSRIDFESSRADCSVLRVWRQDAPQRIISTGSMTLYDSGPLQLYRC